MTGDEEASEPEQQTSSPVSFPDIPVRTGYKTLKMDIIEVLVVAESKYGVERRKVGGLVCYMMNRLAGQRWEEATEEPDVEVPDDDCTEKQDTNDNKKRKRRDIGPDICYSKVKSDQFQAPRCCHAQLQVCCRICCSNFSNGWNYNFGNR